MLDSVQLYVSTHVFTCTTRTPNVHANLSPERGPSAMILSLSFFLFLLYSLFFSVLSRLVLSVGVVKTYGLRYCRWTRLSTSSRELFLNKHRWPASRCSTSILHASSLRHASGLGVLPGQGRRWQVIERERLSTFLCCTRPNAEVAEYRRGLSPSWTM